MNIDAVKKVIADNGLNIYTVCEYRDGICTTLDLTEAANCRNCYSVAKAFVVTAIGMLEDRGLLTTDDPVFPVFADRFPADYDEKWKRVTIAHAMTHTIGFARGFLDIDCDVMSEYPADDLLHMVLSHPLEYEPGAFYAYSDAAFYLLSRIVTEKSGMLLDDFLRQNLFVPMKFREYAMSKCPRGYPIGATGLYITTEDMLKLGILYMQNGVYEGKRYLSERFVQKALGRFEFRVNRNGFAKGGMYGQLLYFDPVRKQVVACHGINKSKSADPVLDAVLQETPV